MVGEGACPAPAGLISIDYSVLRIQQGQDEAGEVAKTALHGLLIAGGTSGGYTLAPVNTSGAIRMRELGWSWVGGG